MKVREIPFSWIVEEEHRIDCGPFTRGGIEAKKLLERTPFPRDKLIDLTLGGLSGIFHVGMDKLRWVDGEEHGIPFLRSADILKSDLSNQPFIHRAQAENNPLFMCPAGTTLITRSGTIGRMAYCRQEMAGMAMSQDVLKVVPNDDVVRSGYLYAFLASKFGVPLVVSGTFGSIIVHIEAENIASLPVPRLGLAAEQRAHDLIEQASQAASEGSELYKRASDEVTNKAGLPDLQSRAWHGRRQLAFTTACSGLRSLRALNNDPRLLSLLAAVRSGPHEVLGDVLTRRPFRPNRFNRVDVEEGRGVALVGQREMFRRIWQGRQIRLEGIPDPGEVCPPRGTIAAACIGTFGEQEVYCRVIRIRQSQVEFALSDNVLQLRADEDAIPAGYLFAVLRSEAFFRAFRCLSIGGKQQVLHPHLVERFPIPIIATAGMRRIEALVVEGDDLLDRSVMLEQQAIALVERAIEESA